MGGGRATSHLSVAPEPGMWRTEWQVVGLSPVALGVLWAAGGLGESQSSGVMMCISLVSRENEQVEMAVGPLPLIHSQACDQGRLWHIGLSV